jgi:peptide/nickel transport system ATP-binding protein
LTAGAIVEVDGLSVAFVAGPARRRVLRDVSFAIGRGETVAIVGESGSGKSTLGLAVGGLLGLSTRSSMLGSIRLDGIEMIGATERVLRNARRDKVGVVFQDPMTSLNPTMTIGRQLKEVTGSRDDAAQWLDRVRVRDPVQRLGDYPHQLSGGERQRVMIAMAMAARPVLLVADEPTTALDVTVQAQVLDLLRDIRRGSETAMMFITHDLGVAAAIADRILVLLAGRIVELGPIDDVLDRPAHPYTAALLASRFGLDVDRSRPLPVSATDVGGDGEGEGCVFLARCPVAADVCQAPPPFRPVRRQQARCWRGEDVDSELALARSIEPAATPRIPERFARDAVLELVHVSKTYRPTGFGWERKRPLVALRDFSLTLNAGDAVALVGESGSGKSTVLKIASGLMAPDSGAVVWKTGDRPHMIFQDATASLTPWMPVAELIGERLRGGFPKRAEREARVAAILTQVGLDPSLGRRRAGDLSGGQCQRVAIARAIAVPPGALLCDEPTSAVDVTIAAGLLNLIGALRRQRGMAIVFVTHDLAAARYVADRILVLKAGLVVDDMLSDDLLSGTRHPYTRQLLDALPSRPKQSHADIAAP